MESLAIVLKSLEQPLGVISTVATDGKPEAAAVYFASDEHLNIFFITRAQSRKYKNLMQNPHAAFVVVSEHPSKTLQIEGTVGVVTDPHEQRIFFPELIALATGSNFLPPISQLPEGEVVFMKLSPRWARLGDFEVPHDDGTFEEVILE